MFEGAQGTLLDIDHGTYPFVTSSNATSGGAAPGSASARARSAACSASPRRTRRAWGAGRCPPSCTGAMGERLRESGQEYGASTGRPRRCGWFDAVAVRYSSRVNGLDALAITKLDVLDGVEEMQICTAYRCHGSDLAEMPGDVAQLAACEPVYETLPGWTDSTRGVTVFDDLPPEARRYIARLEETSGVPAAIISTGSERDHTIIRDPARLKK